MNKKNVLLISFLLLCIFSFAQKKEKLSLIMPVFWRNKDGSSKGYGKCTFDDGGIYVRKLLTINDRKGTYDFLMEINMLAILKIDMMHGNGVYTCLVSDKYVGSLINGVVQGKGVCYYLNGDTYEVLG
ncbi:MAG: hypothetical protein R2836_00940 [Chitinophagales bacterium]